MHLNTNRYTHRQHTHTHCVHTLCVLAMNTIQRVALAAHCVAVLLPHSQAHTDVLAEHEAEPQMQNQPITLKDGVKVSSNATGEWIALGFYKPCNQGQNVSDHDGQQFLNCTKNILKYFFFHSRCIGQEFTYSTQIPYISVNDTCVWVFL